MREVCQNEDPGEANCHQEQHVKQVGHCCQQPAARDKESERLQQAILACTEKKLGNGRRVQSFPKKEMWAETQKAARFGLSQLPKGPCDVSTATSGLTCVYGSTEKQQLQTPSPTIQQPLPWHVQMGYLKEKNNESSFVIGGLAKVTPIAHYD